MKFIKIALTLTALSAITAHANETPKAKMGQPYLGIKAGTLRIDEAQKNANIYGVYGGYRFNSGYGIELDYHTAKSFKINLYDVDFDVKTQMYGGYVTYNVDFTDSIYTKFKIGMNKVDVGVELNDESNHTLFSGKNDHQGVAYGINIGYNLNKNFALDAEYHTPNGYDKTWTLGAKVKF